MVYVYHECIPEGISYNCRLSKDTKDKYITTHNLKLIGKVKEYSINHIKIQTSDKIIFESHNTLSLTYNKPYLIEEVDITNIPSFLFYDTDYEEEYILYQFHDKETTYSLKEYNEFITFEIKSTNTIDN